MVQSNTTTNLITTRRMITPNNMRSLMSTLWPIYKKLMSCLGKESTKKMFITTFSLMTVKTHIYKFLSNSISIISISSSFPIIRANFLHTRLKIHGQKARISSLSKKELLWNLLHYIKIESLLMSSISHKWD